MDRGAVLHAVDEKLFQDNSKDQLGEDGLRSTFISDIEHFHACTVHFTNRNTMVTLLLLQIIL